MQSTPEMIERNRPMVVKLARKVFAQVQGRIDLDDLVASGLEGLLEAQKRFDPEREVQFATFAYYRIRGAMFDHIRRATNSIRQTAASPSQDAALQATRAADAIGESLSLERSQDHEHRFMLVENSAALASALERIGTAFLVAGGGISSLGEQSLNAAEGPEQVTIEREQGVRVQNAVRALPERERQLITRFYLDGLTLDEAAKELGVSKSWASRIHTKALDLLRDELKE